MKATLKIWRYDPEATPASRLAEFQVPYQEGDTVLQALLRIYRDQEPLAFRYGCRFRKCGLCALEVNGRPRLACRTPLRENMTLRPLRALPVVRDLVVDRQPAFATLLPLRPWIEELAGGANPRRLKQPAEHQQLMACTECLGCLSTCPTYHYDDPGCGGPFHFVKLAQFHFHPLDGVDRLAQARDLGIERCASCLKCYCLVGIPIANTAIKPLLGGQ
jgi:succinate dehydrogenase / fumarate reductase iron-sulfur subunit